MFPKKITIMASRNAVPGREYPEVSRKEWKEYCKAPRVALRAEKKRAKMVAKLKKQNEKKAKVSATDAAKANA